MAIPKHIAIIMDGNGRWANLKGRDRSYGHENGIEPLKKAIQKSVELGIKHLTIYSFSSENWNRPQDEVDSLMNLLSRAVIQESEMLISNHIRIKLIGDIDKLPADTRKSVDSVVESTKDFDRLELTVALSYSSKWEISQAVKQIAEEFAQGKLTDINEDTLDNYLKTNGTPDPDLLIRTGGEQRISNFLLWQLSYAELYFTPTLWPDFDEVEFQKAVDFYATRERRFGKTSAQVAH